MVQQINLQGIVVRFDGMHGQYLRRSIALNIDLTKQAKILVLNIPLTSLIDQEYLSACINLLILDKK